MARFAIGCGLLLFSVLQVGCYGPLYDRIKCSGCGPLYLGAYVDDPPRCEPCDRCANYVGCQHCDPCESRFPWDRARLWQEAHDRLARSDARCCGGECCCDEGGQCGEVGCGNVGCGEPGCGAESMHGGEVIYEDAGQPVSTTSSRSPSRIRPVSRSTVVAAKPSQLPAKCDCGRH